MSEANKILIVDDDQEIRDLLASFLQQYGFDVVVAEDGQHMLAELDKQTFDLIILDLMMPGDDGLTLCRKVRANSNIPIIMLTAIGEETDRIIGLEMGADDYLAKPFNPRELLARMKAILRRSHGTIDVEQTEVKPGRTRFVFNGYVLDLAARRLTSEDETEITLSSGEYDLLLALVENPQRVLSRDQLLDITKNRECGPFDRSIDVQISRIRHKIEEDPKNPLVIKTVRGGGYIFTPEVERTVC